MSERNSHKVEILGFTEANLLDLLDTLKDEYPIAESLAHGELEELGTWIKDLWSEIKDLISVKTMMYLETVEGREQEGKR